MKEVGGLEVPVYVGGKRNPGGVPERPDSRAEGADTETTAQGSPLTTKRHDETLGKWALGRTFLLSNKHEANQIQISVSASILYLLNVNLHIAMTTLLVLGNCHLDLVG